jgi:hypothetical protein
MAGKKDTDAETLVGCGCLVSVFIGFVLVATPILIGLWRWALA